jgi:tetratricopeptide (TPR) repeat protein
MLSSVFRSKPVDKFIDEETLTDEHPTRMQLMQYANGSLDASQTTWMESHIAACNSCCQQLEEAPVDRLTHLLRKSPSFCPTECLRLVSGYQILEELGRGGMGIVYRAVQPALNRQVAIKMIGQLARASQQELSRFRLEAEACAAMNHPNIAQVYDVGEMDGQPYIAMELVRGPTLAEYLQQQPMEYEQATRLLIALTQAVQHAHACGIIHRDLKPTNILLKDFTSDDSDIAPLRPKIVDFGLAKRIDATAELTSIGNILGTPSYMSPELAAGNASLVGPSTDIYSLGAVLYEALVGRPPFKGATAVETLAQVRSAEPARPSILRSEFPKDLETICLKCLEKVPENRYASASDLLEDLQRFQDRRPILAKPASLSRRAMQWSKRHPTVVALIGVSLLACLGLFSLGLIYNASLRNALREADGERSRANENFLVAFQSVERMLDRVGFAQLAETPEMEDVREKLLADAVEFYSELLQRQPEADVQSRRQYYSAMARLGRIQWTLGQQETALKNLQESIDLQTQLSRETPEAYDIRHDLAVSYINRSQVTGDRNDSLMAVELLEEISDEYPESKTDLAKALNSLALSTTSIEEREQLHRRVKAFREELLASSPEDPQFQYGLAETQHNLAFLLTTTGRDQEAEAAYRDALRIFENLVNSQNSVSDYHRALAECLTHLASLMHFVGRTEEAAELIQRGTETRRVLAARFPKLPSMREAVIRGLLTEAAFLIQLSRFESASRLSEQAVEMATQLTQEFPTRKQRFVEASCLTIWATALSGGSDPTAARSAFERANKIYDDLLTTDPNDVDVQMEAGVQFMNYSNTLRLENPRLAGDFNDRSVALLENVYKQFPQRTDVKSYLFNAHGARAVSYDALNDHPEALVSWTRALELSPPERHTEIGLLRALTLARCGEAALAAEAAKGLLEQDDVTGAHLYNVACVFGLLHQFGQRKGDSNLSEIPLEELSQSAIELLSRPAAIQFLQDPNNRQQLMVDKDLESVRTSPLFGQLLDRITPIDPQ